MNKRKIFGFSLTEVLVVVAMVGILASISVPGYKDYLQKARRGEAIREINETLIALKKKYMNASPNVYIYDYSLYKSTKYYDIYTYYYQYYTYYSYYYVIAYAKSGTTQATDTEYDSTYNYNYSCSYMYKYYDNYQYPQVCFEK